MKRRNKFNPHVVLYPIVAVGMYFAGEYRANSKTDFTVVGDTISYKDEMHAPISTEKGFIEVGDLTQRLYSVVTEKPEKVSRASEDILTEITVKD